MTEGTVSGKTQSCRMKSIPLHRTVYPNHKAACNWILFGSRKAKRVTLAQRDGKLLRIVCI